MSEPILQTMNSRRAFRNLLRGIALLAAMAGSGLYAGTATNITGLYYTGLNSSGGLQDGGSTDENWTVIYAKVNGYTYTGTSTYTGDAYVLSGDYIDSAYVENSSTAQWITAPGAMTSSWNGTANVGGDYLPGNGTSGTNSAQYAYALDFSISGTGGGTVSNDVSISLTIAADDNYAVYVNPVYRRDGTIDTRRSQVAASGTAAWDNTTTVYLQNFYDSNGYDNANFVIGTNTIVIVVTNSNSISGSSYSTSLNPSGLLVYQVGSVATIDGNPVPEVGAWLPVVGAISVFGLMLWRRRREKLLPVI